MLNSSIETVHITRKRCYNVLGLISHALFVGMGVDKKKNCLLTISRIRVGSPLASV